MHLSGTLYIGTEFNKNLLIEILSCALANNHVHRALLLLVQNRKGKRETEREKLCTIFYDNNKFVNKFCDNNFLTLYIRNEI